MSTVSTLRDHLDRHLAGYDEDREVDLPGLTSSLGVYGVCAAALSLWLRRHPAVTGEVATRDLVIGGVAVHKLSRLLTKAEVTSPLRAPFTEFEGPAGAAEHHESPRGERGLRHSVGTLLTCPFCLGTWLSTAYVAGLLVAPRATRAWVSVLTVTAGSDFLQHVYARVRT